MAISPTITQNTHPSQTWWSRIKNACSCMTTFSAKTAFKVISLEAFRFIELKIAQTIVFNVPTEAFCLPKVLKTYFPRSIPVFRDIAKTIGENKKNLCTALSFSQPSHSCIITGVMVEEIYIRCLLQEGLGRQLPQLILKKISPAHASMVNSMPMRITRVIGTALFFTFLHQKEEVYMVCETHAMTSNLVISLAYAAVQEYTGNPLYAFYFHARQNLAANFF